MAARILVLGASGSIGKATLEALVSSRHAGDNLEVFAGVRDPSKFTAPSGVTVVQANSGDNVDKLAAVLKNYQRLFIVTPSTEDRAELATNALKAAKAAGIQFILLLSVSTAPSGSESIFGRQFLPLEQFAATVNVPLTIIRLPIFLDNLWGHKQTIQEQGTFYDPRDPTKLHTPVLSTDVGKASAAILADPTLHAGKTYELVSPPFSLNDFAAALTKELGKEVKPTTVPYSAAKDALLGYGVPEWQADGILELYKYIDNDSKYTNNAVLGDIEAITGEKPITIEEWVAQNAAAFK